MEMIERYVSRKKKVLGETYRVVKLQVLLFKTFLNNKALFAQVPTLLVQNFFTEYFLLIFLNVFRSNNTMLKCLNPAP